LKRNTVDKILVISYSGTISIACLIIKRLMDSMEQYYQAFVTHYSLILDTPAMVDK